jgi:hypothetical protein
MSATGTWKLTIDTPIGKQTPTLTIAEEGGDYKGTVHGPTGTVEIEELNVEGDKFAFKAEMDTPMGKFRLTFKGIAEGDAVSGDIQTPIGLTPFTGERM